MLLLLYVLQLINEVSERIEISYVEASLDVRYWIPQLAQNGRMFVILKAARA